MTSEIIAGTIGLIAAVSGSLDSSVVNRNVSEVCPVIEISEQMREKRVLPKGVRIENNRISVNLNARYEVPDHFSFDPFKGVLESNLTENGKFGYKIGEGYKDRDNDFYYRLNKESPAHYVLDYFDNFKVTQSGLLEETKQVLSGGNWKDFDVSGMSLSELIGMGKKTHEFSKIRSGDGFWKYIIDLDAKASGKSSVVFEKDFVGERGSRVEVVNGLFSSGEVEAGVYFEAGANWDKKDLSAGIGVDAKFFYEWKIENGFFIEAKNIHPNGNFFGGGAIGKKSESEFRSEECSLNAGVNAWDLNARAEFESRRVKEGREEREDVLYLIGGFEDESWVFFGTGVEKSRKEGFYKIKGKGQRFDVGLDGIKKKNLNLNISERVEESSLGLVYSIAGNKNVFSRDCFDVDVYGYLKNYPNKKLGIGGSLRSDLVNLIVDDEEYFGTVKLFGKGGSFENNFKKRIERKASFLEEYINDGSLWKNKKGVYGFIEGNNVEKKLGAAVCFGGLYSSGGVIEGKGTEGYFAEIGGKGARIKGSYSKSELGNVEKVDLGLEVKISDNCYIMGFGSHKGKDSSGVVEMKFLF